MDLLSRECIICHATVYLPLVNKHMDWHATNAKIISDLNDRLNGLENA